MEYIYTKGGAIHDQQNILILNSKYKRIFFFLKTKKTKTFNAHNCSFMIDFS